MEKKKYIVPEMDAMMILESDIITVSPGTAGDPLSGVLEGNAGSADW
ncbi:MAG: hypothetical protein IJW55_01735 [Clostridia bacterium]|nr:hypothetical protein [Clostridia bacterium]